MMGYSVAVDIGGTFTDLVICDRKSGAYRCHKVPTTKPDLAVGVIRALSEAMDRWDEVEFFVHGTTYGLNTLLQRNGARTAVVATRGFGDVYLIGRGNRPDMYNLHYQKPEPLVPRRDIYEVNERVLWDGEIEQELDCGEIERLAERLEDAGVESVAVALLHAYAERQHELLIRDRLSELLPGVEISLSHEVANEWREYERTSSTVLNAYIAPRVRQYMDSLRADLSAGGLRCGVHVMQSSGGLMTLPAARQRPIHTLLSGPVGGAVGVAHLAGSDDGSHLIGVDMGGTSFDASLVIGGEVETAAETVIEGMPLLMPIVNIFSVGAGGGSIAYELAGGLRVGPESAGSDPGPACYGRGGTRPTVTDANLLLGRIGMISGLELDRAAAEQAVAKLAEQLQMDVVELAEGIAAVVGAKMAGALRQITVARGIDPREFTLVAFGGGGPVHAVFLAEELEIEEVIVPPYPATFSAWGMLQCDVRIDVARTEYRLASAEDTAEAVEAVFCELEADAVRQLVSEGIGEQRMTLVRSADMRYVGQEYTVAVPAGGSVRDMVALFHDSHRTRYGHASPQGEVEFVGLRVTALGAVQFVEQEGVRTVRSGVVEVERMRRVRFDGSWHDSGVVLRSDLGGGSVVNGPVLIEEEGTTTVVPPGWRGIVDEKGCIVLRRGGRIDG